MYIAIRLYFK